MANLWYNSVAYLDGFLSLWLEISAYILLFFLWFIFVFVLSIIFVRIFKKRMLKFKEKLVYGYDSIFYIISTHDYQTSWNSWLSIMNSIFDLKKPGYLKNFKLINTEVRKIEENLWQKIISEEIWSKIKTLHKRVWSNVFFYKIFKFIIIISLLLLISAIIYFYRMMG